VKKGHCRLCWCQARLDRSARLGGATGTYTLLLPDVRRVRHHQLFFAGMPAPRDLRAKPASRRRGVGSGARGVPRKPPPPPAARPRREWLQPPLFDTPRRDYRYGRFDLRRQAAPDNPWLASALHIAHGLGEARGFDPEVLCTLNRILVMLLAGHTDGELIRVSDIQRVLRQRGNGLEHTNEVLDTIGVLLDDRRPAFDTWLEDKLRGLAPAIGRQTHRWARTLRDGGPRVRPRNEKTVRHYVAAMLPALTDWSARYQHLREISRRDVVAHVTALQGHQRHTTALALRSLFGWAKKNGVVFANPTAHLRVGRVAPRIPQPLTVEELTPTIQAATSPQARLAIALAGVHAARHGEIIDLRLSDVDLSGRRLTVAGRTRPLDELTHRLLLDWLDHRRRRWPNTANPHLLVTVESALGLGPVTRPWLNRVLRGLPATLERLRVDRQLEEALASGADPLHLAEVFGVCETTAVRYADAARQLLDTGADLDTGIHGEPAGPPMPEPPDRPSGSP